MDYFSSEVIVYIFPNFLQRKFDVDINKQTVRDAIDSCFKERLKGKRCTLHKYYLSLPEGVNKLNHAPKTVTQEVWESLCRHFATEKYKVL